MLIKRPDPIPSSEITPEPIYLDRRRFIERAGQGLAAAALAPSSLAACEPGDEASPTAQQEELTPFEDVTTYNNYYEFGTDKSDPARNSAPFKPRPWTVAVEGHCENPGQYGIEDLIRTADVEERVYRLRCVEAWSMVIPWRGVPLRKVIDRLAPTSAARFVAFETVFRPAEMIGQRRPVLEWPYVEGLRMDEARHDLTLLATGLYGRDLLNQNGAPLRLVVPWKYGFKGIKSIVKISFVEDMPPTTWNIMASQEYGFYANVNPEVDHPRWSQARERRIGEFLRRPTLMFNGYGDQVGQLYAGLDLAKWY
jgi:sulfoxide reductase catalytic subunit YedY